MGIYFLLSLHWVSDSLVQDIRSHLSFWWRRRVLHMVILMVIFVLFSSIHLRICEVLLAPWYLVDTPCSSSMLLLGLIQLHGPRVVVVVIHQRLSYQRLTPWIANIVGIFFFQILLLLFCFLSLLFSMLLLPSWQTSTSLPLPTHHSYSQSLLALLL